MIFLSPLATDDANLELIKRTKGLSERDKEMERGWLKENIESPIGAIIEVDAATDEHGEVFRNIAIKISSRFMLNGITHVSDGGIAINFDKYNEINERFLA